MNRQAMFVQLVQTFALARVATVDAYRQDGNFAAIFSMSCVASAQRIDEGAIPENIEEACDEFMHYMDKTLPTIERPTWMPL